MLSQERQAQFKITSSGSLQGFLIWVEACFRAELMYVDVFGLIRS